MNEPLRIPLFTFTWPAACSPHAQAVEQHVIEWIGSQQLVPNHELRDRIIRARYGWLAARCYPTAPLELLKTIADYIAWLFLVDDLFLDRVQTLSARTVAHLTAIIDVLDLNTVQAQPVYGERALLDICERLRQQLDVERFQHFAHGTRMMYGGAALQVLAHLTSESITPHQYACIRRHGSGMIPCMALIDSVPHTHLEGDVRFSAEVEELKNSANTIVSLSNDIFSLGVELKQPGQYENIVTLLAGPADDLQQGIDITAHTIRTEVEQFTQLSEQLLIHASPALKHYINGLRHWISGHQRWVSGDTARYDAAFLEREADQRLIADAVECAHFATAS